MCQHMQHGNRLVCSCSFMRVFGTESVQCAVGSLRSEFLIVFVFSVVPHITDAIQEWVMKQARITVDNDGVEPQVCVIEVSCSITFLLNTRFLLTNNTCLEQSLPPCGSGIFHQLPWVPIK